jgi:Holliday junction resolvase RusA-like endonuclease
MKLEVDHNFNKIKDTLLAEAAVSIKEGSKAEQKALDAIYAYDNIKWNKIEILYIGEPKAQARARLNTSLNFFYDPDVSLKQHVLEQVKAQLPENFKPLDNEVKIYARFYRKIPKNTTIVNKYLMEFGAIPCLKKPDLDNYIKLFMDSLLNVLFTDDALVTKIDIEKLYSQKPRVELLIVYR